MHDQPDAGLWEFRTRTSVHTYSSVMSWAACDRLANAAEALGLDERAALLAGAGGAAIRARIEREAWYEPEQRFAPASAATSSTPACSSSSTCASWSRTIRASAPPSKRSSGAAPRRAHAALRRRGRFRPARDGVQLLHLLADRGAAPRRPQDEARGALRAMLERLTPAGLLSEDTDFETGELWGNYPQTYSLVGLINCAVLLSKPWSAIDEPPDRHLQPRRRAQAARAAARRAGSPSRCRRRFANIAASGSAGRATRPTSSPARSTSSATRASPPRRSTSKSRTSRNIITATPTARLWPLFHYRIDLAEYDRSFAGGYERVNERFAETVAPLIEPDDLVWVHDYHLIPLGQQLRERGLKNRIGFFLHIPWPPSRLMVSLPFHEGLVLSLLAYDVIGFQTEEWLESFRHYVERELGGHCDPDGTIHVGERSVHAAAYPIGIDYKEFSEAALTARPRAGAFRPAEGKRGGQAHHHRRRPARLFQGAGGALPRLPPLPGGA
jgi:hypothetical protein